MTDRSDPHALAPEASVPGAIDPENDNPGKTIYDELPDAPPRKRIRLSWVRPETPLV